MPSPAGVARRREEGGGSGGKKSEGGGTGGSGVGEGQQQDGDDVATPLPLGVVRNLLHAGQDRKSVLHVEITFYMHDALPILSCM